MSAETRKESKEKIGKEILKSKKNFLEREEKGYV